MKISRERLKEIVKEEISSVMQEQVKKDPLEEMIGGEEEPTMGDIKYAEKRAYDMQDEAHDGLADLVSGIQQRYDVSTDKALSAIATILRAMEKEAER